MNTASVKYKPANRLKMLSAVALLKWVQSEQATSRCESARHMAERASRELGFTITIHNIKRMRGIVAQEMTKHHP